MMLSPSFITGMRAGDQLGLYSLMVTVVQLLFLKVKPIGFNQMWQPKICDRFTSGEYEHFTERAPMKVSRTR